MALESAHRARPRATCPGHFVFIECSCQADDAECDNDDDVVIVVSPFHEATRPQIKIVQCLFDTIGILSNSAVE